MKTLVLDTANSIMAIGLYDNDVLLEKRVMAGNRQQSEMMLPLIVELCANHHIEILDISNIVLTIGPGSYTGVRIALTFAKTLATVHDVKIYPVSSLQALVGDKKAMSVLDARSKKVFVGVYNNNQKVIDECVIDIANFADFKAQYTDYTIVGDTSLVGIESEECDTLVENMFAIAKHIEPVASVHNLVPTYLKD